MKNYTQIILLAFCLFSCTTTTIKNKDIVVFNKSQYGNKWPFSVDQIEVFCEGASDVYFTANGTTYALNGAARGKVNAGNSNITSHDMEELRLSDPNFTDSKMAIPPDFVEQGLRLCK